MLDFFKTLDLSNLSLLFERFSVQTDYPIWVIVVLLVLVAYSILSFIIISIGVYFTDETHAENILASYEVLTVIRARLSKKDYKGAFYHLRFKVDPYVFEECLLSAFENDPLCKVYRSQAYSGDGGIDGKVVYKGDTWLIQAKRYKSYINPKHVQSHIELCSYENARGLFIHTGKSGRKGVCLTGASSTVSMVSGRVLLHLLAGTYKPSFLLERLGKAS